MRYRDERLTDLWVVYLHMTLALREVAQRGAMEEVLDLLDQRESLKEAIEHRSIPSSGKSGHGPMPAARDHPDRIAGKRNRHDHEPPLSQRKVHAGSSQRLRYHKRSP